MGNMPVIKDMIVDMDAVHWKKVRRVTPWLINKRPPARARVHRAERVDGRRHPDDGLHPVRRLRVATAWRWRWTPASSGRRRWPRPTASSATRATKSSASACATSPKTPRASMTAPTASSAWRPAPRASTRWARSCACGVSPGSDQHIVDQQQRRAPRGDGRTLIRDYGLLHEAEMLPRSYGGNSWFGKFHPAAGKELLSSLPVAIRGMLKRKMRTKIALFGHKIPAQDLKAVKRIYEKVESAPERYELNLYITGEDEDPNEHAPVSAGSGAAMPSAPGPEGTT